MQLLRASRARGLAAAVLTLAHAALPPLAGAQPAPALPELSEVDKETARRLMDRGVEREEASDHAAALKYYQAAHALVRLPMTGMAVARAQEGLKHYLEASATAAEVKALPRWPNETPAYDRARGEADAMLARLEKRTPALRVIVAGAEAQTLTLDGVPLPQEALRQPHKVNPGRHVLQAETSDRRSVRVEVTAGEGELVPVTLRLDAAAEPGRAPQGGGGLPALSWVGFGLGATGLVLGGVTGAMTLSLASDLRERKDRCGGPCDAAYRADLDTSKTLASASNVSFAAGAAGVAVGVVALLLSRDQEPRTAAAGRGVQLVPWAGLGAALSGVY